MNGFKFYCLLSALGIIIGESWFVYSTDKIAPLWIDDYFIAGIMLFAVRQWDKQYSKALILGCWMFIAGNLYAMLFSRLEPINPDGRPWKLLAILVVWSALSALYSFYRLAGKTQQR